MSFIFDIQGRTVWSPALRVGHIFVGYAQAIGGVLSIPPGFIFNANDMIEIETTQFATFVHKLHLVSEESEGYRILANMVDSVRIPCLVMLERSGLEIDNDAATQELLDAIRPTMPV